MVKIDLDEIFFEVLEAAKPFVPESDHVEMCLNILRSLNDQGYSFHELYGHEEIVDEALEILYPEVSGSNDYYDNEEY